MGYRSDVAYLIIFGDGQDAGHARGDEGIKLQASALARFKQFLSEAKVNEKTMGVFNEEVDSPNKEGMYIDYERGYIKYFAEAVKWYETFDDVTCHIEFLSLVGDYIEDRNDSPNPTPNIGYSFVRIGEEYNDIETSSDGHWGASEMLYPTRRIVFEI